MLALTITARLMLSEISLDRTTIWGSGQKRSTSLDVGRHWAGAATVKQREVVTGSGGGVVTAGLCRSCGRVVDRAVPRPTRARSGAGACQMPG